MSLLEKKELKIILLLVGGLFLWFQLVVRNLDALAGRNFVLIYIMFIIGYSFIVLNYFFKTNPLENIRIFISFTIVTLLGDLLLPPYLVSPSSGVDLSSQAKFSSDVVIFSLLPKIFSPAVASFFVYVIAPVILLLLISFLVRQSKFAQLLGRVV